MKELHGMLSRKTLESAIIKALDWRQKFENEHYIIFDIIFIKCDKDTFYFRIFCIASMNMKRHSTTVELITTTSEVIYGSRFCPSGKSGY